MKLLPLITAGLFLLGCASTAPFSSFEGNTDVGQVRHTGSFQALPEQNGYRVSGSGEDIWGTADAFHFAWRRLSGDLSLTARVGWEGAGKTEDRKGGWMVRQSLEPDAPYADAVSHGDGHIAIQYREVKGGPTRDVEFPVIASAVLRLDRDGDLFTLSVAVEGKPYQPVASVTVVMTDPVYVGLAVTSNDADALETAIFSEVGLESHGKTPAESRVLESTLEIIDIATNERRIVHRDRSHFEAPNWTPDGLSLLYNSGGRLYTIPITGGVPVEFNTGTAVQLNNDHGYSPDGQWIAISDNTQGIGSQIYVVPATGGEPRLVTPLAPSYWHGWSPDGKYLAYPAQRDGDYDIYIIPAEGGEEIRLTEAVGLDDGSDYTPDGNYIWLNSVRTGVMKLFRMAPDGSNEEQMTFNEAYGDWFPHPSPDGKWIAFLSFDRSVEGHPANKDVILRLMPAEGGEPRVIATLFGGQGTINVPSWSPDSRHFAFVSYRLVAP